MATASAAPVPGRRTPAALLLPGLVMLPPMHYYVGFSSSLAVGTVLASIALWGLALWWTPPRQHGHLVTHYGLLAMIMLTMHLGLATVLGPVDLARGLGSLLLLAIVLAGSAALADLLANAYSWQVLRGATTCVHLLGLSALLGILRWGQPDLATFGKSVFPFTEPSHLALFASPFLITVCVYATPAKRLLYLIASLVATALLQNLTMAAVCIIVALVCLRLSHLLLLLTLLVPAVTALDMTYYAERLDFGGDTENLSTLVFIQGWQLMDEAWSATRGLGRGFQQLGVFGTDVSAADLIYIIYKDSLNLLDGSFTMSKLVSELGIFGIGLLIAYAVCAWRAARLLRRVSSGREHVHATLALAAASLLSYLTELVVRGAGYFTPTGLLFLASLWIWLRRPRPMPVRPQPNVQRPALV